MIKRNISQKVKNGFFLLHLSFPLTEKGEREEKKEGREFDFFVMKNDKISFKNRFSIWNNLQSF